MAGHKQRKFSTGGTRPPPENRQTDAAPIRARAPLIEQFYVAVDRQLKSGFETYEAADPPDLDRASHAYIISRAKIRRCGGQIDTSLAWRREAACGHRPTSLLSRCSAVAEHLLCPRQRVGIAAIKEPGLRVGKELRDRLAGLPER